jgi:hypothetical protein
LKRSLNSTNSPQTGEKFRKDKNMRSHFYGSLLLGERELMGATVRNQVLLSTFTDFENFSVFKPDARMPGMRSRSMKCSTKSSPGRRIEAVAGEMSIRPEKKTHP